MNDKIKALYNSDSNGSSHSGYFVLKGKKEKRAKLLKQAESIQNQADQQNRNLTAEEQREFEKIHREFNTLNMEIKQMEKHREGRVSSFHEQGGKALNESGSIRLYNPNQRISADIEEGDLDLGSYLRAVVDKPRSDIERQAIQNSVDSSGYSMPKRVASELIDKLRAINPVVAAGARTISIEGLDSTKFVRIDGDPDAVWHTELTEQQLSDPNFSAVEMKPKTVLALAEISREVLQDAANLEEALTTTFVGSINNAILEATFTGSAANSPTGLATVVEQTEEYTNGGDPDWSHFVKASKTLHDNNVPEDGRSFIYAPDVWETLALATDNQGRYQDAPSFIRDVPGYTSSGVSAGEGYAGDFSNVVYGFRLNITLEQHNSFSVRKYGTIWLAAARLDMAVFRPSALVRIEEAAAG
jgi:HK97 family phage major capsid protein